MLGIYWRIVLPLVKPAPAAVPFLTFMGTWNDFMGPLIYTSSVGLLQGRAVVVVHTERGDRTRFISARKATNYEETAYYEQVHDCLGSGGRADGRRH